MASSSKKRKTESTAMRALAQSACVKGDDSGRSTAIELLDQFKKLRKSWPKDMARILDPSLPDERRSELWEIMCSGGDALRRRFAWAVPDERALRIIKHFGPIVEIGSGLGYWAMLLRARGVDINAYDKKGGAPDGNADTAESASSKAKGTSARKDTEVKGAADLVKEGEALADGMEKDDTSSFWIKVNEGGPDVLEEPCNENRSLFLCYPDDFEGETESLGLRCLHAFEGDMVIHVGELFGDSVSMTPGQSPWGRTTSQECQEELASKFHCMLKVPLPSWPHSRDTLSVWKRHSFCTVQYDDDDSSGDEADEKHSSEDSKLNVQDNEQGESGIILSMDGGRKVPAKGSRNGVTGRAVGQKGERSAKDDSDSEDTGGSQISGSDDAGSVEGLPIGMPDFDMYAFIPADEQLPYAQAAPSVSFLLDAQ